MPVTVSAQELTKEQSLAGLCEALGILEKWSASKEQTCSTLRLSRITYSRAKRRPPGWSVALDSDQILRSRLVLSIHEALLQVFENPRNVYGFPAMPNNNAFFNGRSPLEIMSQGDMGSLYETFRHIDALRGSQW